MLLTTLVFVARWRKELCFVRGFHDAPESLTHGFRHTGKGNTEEQQLDALENQHPSQPGVLSVDIVFTDLK